MPRSGLLDAAVMAVPGLAFLVGTLVLPGALLAGLASAVLAVAVSAVIGYVLTHRAAIAAWPARVAGRRILGAAALAAVLLVAYVLAYGTVVTDYEWPAGSDRTVDLLVPATVADGGLAFPYVDCTLSFEDVCRPGAEGSREAVAASADGVAARMGDDGPGAYAIPRGAAWIAWVVLLVGAHAVTGAALVVLFGLLRLRGVDAVGFFRNAGDPAAPPGPAPPPADPPVV